MKEEVEVEEYQSVPEARPKSSPIKSAARMSSRSKVKLLQTGLLLLVCLSLGFLGGWAGSRSNHDIQTPEVKQQIISSESQLINEIAKNVGPSVVSINVTGTASTRSFFGDSVEQQSAGTGVIISKDGVIMTNRHVVPTGTDSVSVTLSDGTTLKNVEVIGRTSESDSLDVAFLKVTNTEGKTLTPAKLGDSGKVQVGDKVIAIGNALGQFQNTVTSGIISGFGRSVEAGDETGTSSETLQNLFQTDTAINAGNSGGPLVNTNSEVIGLNTAVAGNAENIGFAIPINDLQGLINSVLKEGKLLRPYLGVRYISLTDDVAYQYNLDVKRGAYLAPQDGQSAVLDNSPAAKAGLKEKDIITKIDGVAIDEDNSLTSVLGRHSVGDKVTVTVIRDGKTQTLQATLEAAPTQ
jgi:serine protease Do